MTNRHPDAVFECLTLLRAVPRAALPDWSALLAEHLLLRHQLAVLTRPTRRRPRLRTRDTLLWLLARRLRRDWRQHLVLVRPEAVVRWHRHAWRLFWRWRSRTRLGRPRLRPGVRELIATMSGDNPLWGSDRIRGELRKLGITVSNRSIRRYRWRGPGRPRSQGWRTFLRNHAHAIWAADLWGAIPDVTRWSAPSAGRCGGRTPRPRRAGHRTTDRADATAASGIPAPPRVRNRPDLYHRAGAAARAAVVRPERPSSAAPPSAPDDQLCQVDRV